MANTHRDAMNDVNNARKVKKGFTHKNMNSDKREAQKDMRNAIHSFRVN